MTETTTTTPRPAPKRKFAVVLGALELTKRMTVAEARELRRAAPGAQIALHLDGAVFLFDADLSEE